MEQGNTTHVHDYEIETTSYSRVDDSITICAKCKECGKCKISIANTTTLDTSLLDDEFNS